MENGLKVGQRIELVEILTEGETWFTPTGSQRLVYPDDMPLTKTTGGRRHIPGTCYVYGHAKENGVQDTYDIFMFRDELKPIGCFIVKEVFTNSNPCTII